MLEKVPGRCAHKPPPRAERRDGEVMAGCDLLDALSEEGNGNWGNGKKIPSRTRERLGERKDLAAVQIRPHRVVSEWLHYWKETHRRGVGHSSQDLTSIGADFPQTTCLCCRDSLESYGMNWDEW